VELVEADRAPYLSLPRYVYDRLIDRFENHGVGSGFTDEDLAKLPELLEPHKISHKHARVDSGMEADVWFEPEIVLEMR